MIRQIIVNGFKTLTEFEMDFKPGLNILVGPNGSGKTNIISFFEFLGYLQDMNIPDAISKSGGAGSILTKIAENKYQNSISATITGTVKLGYKRYLYYQYHFRILLRETGESIVYSDQKLMIKLRTVESIAQQRIHDYDLVIGLNINANSNVVPAISKINENLKELNRPYDSPHKLSKDEITKRIKQTLTSLDPDESIISRLRMICRAFYYPIYADIHGGQVYNIEPSKAKTPDDSAKTPGVGKDGSGLYSTLYALTKTKKNRRQNVFFRPFFSSSRYREDATLENILKYTRLANKWITNINVTNNAFDQQLRVRVVLQGLINTSTILPLSSMSDGTVKWISLVTIILTNQTMFAIEEPENYLHPLMLSELISIMRAHMKKDRFVIMSTHSETLLNNAVPEEIIVISYTNGKTTAKRIPNAEALSEEIRNTGFGLGYYYISGSVGDE